MEGITVTAAMFLPDVGLILDVPDRREDFWLYLGELAGWARFSRRVRRKPGCVMTTAFEAVEVRREPAPAPSPAAYIANVLWRQKAVLEASGADDFSRLLVAALAQGNSQAGQ